jgi:hypothetical protein
LSQGYAVVTLDELAEGMGGIPQMSNSLPQFRQSIFNSSF